MASGLPKSTSSPVTTTGKTIQQSQLNQRRARPAAAGGGRQGQGDATATKRVDQADHTGNWCNFEMHLPEDAILAPAEFLELGIWTISEKMTQDVAALAAIKNEVQLRLRHLASEGLEKQPPGVAMHGVTVDKNAIHVKDDSAQLPGAHEVSPENMRCARTLRLCRLVRAGLELPL